MPQVLGSSLMQAQVRPELPSMKDACLTSERSCLRFAAYSLNIPTATFGLPQVSLLPSGDLQQVGPSVGRQGARARGGAGAGRDGLTRM